MAVRTYTTFEIGKICGVYPTTVINWVKQKKLTAFTTPGGHRRVKHSDLVEFLGRYKFPVPPELTASRRRVLIVEDDRAVSRMLARAFEQYPEQFEVQVVEDGMEALVEIGRRPPDLVLLDVVIPNIDGARVCATLKADEATRHIRVFAMTGKKLSPRTEQFLRRTADGFYRKPFDVRAVLRRATDRLRISLPV